jgi:hypothetical protein
MLRHAISMVAAGLIIALSLFFALRSHHGNKEIGPPDSGLMGSKCQSVPDNDLIPAEQTCEKP